MSITGLVAGCAPDVSPPSPASPPISATPAASNDPLLATAKRQDDVALALVGRLAQRLGGTILVALPGPTSVRVAMANVPTLNGSAMDSLVSMSEIHLVADGEVIERGHLFDTVRTIRSDDPANVDFGDADYKLWLDRYGPGPNKWTLVKRGGGSRELVLPPGQVGRLVWMNGLNVAVLNAAADLGAPVTRMPLPMGPGAIATGSISGTAFFIDAAGHAITNAHVAGGCKAIKMALGNGRIVEASLVAKDVQNDLALLLVSPAPAAYAHFSAASSRQGEEIVSYGYPLAGALSTQGNLSTGIISALVGLGDDSRLLQISAPVQPGNSGGPLLDLEGSVVGVVSSKINALKVAAMTGDIPQNINFAIKSNVVLNFLETNGVTVGRSAAKKVMAVEDISDEAKTFTFMVTCER
jgi:S1-C subfamily serine protease